MTWSYQIDRPRGRVMLRVSGEFSDRDALECDDRMRSDPDLCPDHSQLIDLRETRGTIVTPAGVRALAERAPLFSPGSHRAIVAPTDVAFGTARMFELLRAGKAGEIRVFRDLDEAMAWLEAG